jgi:transcriptional regulator with XRE-family HTH domain
MPDDPQRQMLRLLVRQRRLHLSNLGDRLAEACRARNLTHQRLCASVGIGGKSAINLTISGEKALSLYRVAQIADRLEVSIDWLLGRTNVMSVLEITELPEG